MCELCDLSEVDSEFYFLFVFAKLWYIKLLYYLNNK